MSPQFFFHPAAEQELNEAAAYYEAGSRGLGRAFLQEVEHGVQHVLEYPESPPLVNRLVRRKVVRRFPYAVMYSIGPKGLRILANANQSRRPFYWRGRK
jgi:plasmid stabilization system protein ParE